MYELIRAMGRDIWSHIGPKRLAAMPALAIVGQTNVPMIGRVDHRALSSLIPDFVVRLGERVFIFDAKIQRSL